MLYMQVHNNMECFPSYSNLYKPSMLLQPSRFQASGGLHIPSFDRAPYLIHPEDVGGGGVGVDGAEQLNVLALSHRLLPLRAGGNHAGCGLV